MEGPVMPHCAQYHEVGRTYLALDHITRYTRH